MDGISELAAAARDLRAARRRLGTAVTKAKDAAMAAHQDDIPETVIASALNVNRMTVRRWLGKLA